MLSSNTPSRVHITIYQDDVPPSRRSNKRILSDEMDVTPHSRKIMRNRSPSQSRTPMNSLRISGKPRVPLCDKVNLTPYNPQRVLINKSKSTTPKTTKTVTFSESHTIYENDVTSASKKFKNESGQVGSIDSYRRRIEQLEAELRNQIDENQKQNEEIQKYRQEIERALERVKYLALGYKNELYGPVYIDGDHTSINKLLRHLSKIAGQEIINKFREETLVDDELPALNQIFAWFEESGFLKYEVLKEFRAVKAVLSMDLTYTFEKIKRDSNNVFSVKNSLKSIEIEPQNSNYLMQNANRLVSVFGLPNGFKYLKSLKLSYMPIKDSYFNNFRGLNLEELVIDNTGIGDEALAYLVALRDNLCLLNITGNKKITDDSIFILVLFEKLMVLLLDDTSISMDGIRKFVSKTASTELSQISIPSSCREYLNKRKEIYCVEHKQGMKVDPLDVKFMSLSEIRQQLKFHFEVNTNINIVGSKEELEELLREILRRRRDDAKAMLLTGGRD